jgi:hypothetical protein
MHAIDSTYTQQEKRDLALDADNLKDIKELRRHEALNTAPTITLASDSPAGRVEVAQPLLVPTNPLDWANEGPPADWDGSAPLA